MDKKLVQENGVVRVIHGIEKVERALSVILFNLILFSLFWQAFTRKINHPASWTEEFSRLLFVYMGVLGCHLAQRENIHVRIDALLLSLPKKFQLGIEVFTDVVMIGLFGMTFYYTFSIVQRKAFTPLVTLGVGESWLYGAMFVLCALTIVEMVAQLVNIFRHGTITRVAIDESDTDDFYVIQGEE